MVQDQLVEYITSQLKAGASGETVKATLVAAGWQSADVDDTLKKVQPPATTASPTVSAAQPASAGFTTGISMVAGPKTIATGKIEPQTIRVSDLVSASSSDKVMSMSSTTAKAADTRAEATKKFLSSNNMAASPAGTTGAGAQAAAARSSTRGPITIEIILGALMVVFGGIAIYFFFANQGLSGQVAALTTQSSGVSGQVVAMQNQLNASTTALAAEVASTTAANQDLALGLSFYAAPLGSAATSVSTSVLNGTVSGGGTKPYMITMDNGARVVVANSKDPKVVVAMGPLVGTTMVQFGGTYTPGIDSITLTEINGVSLLAPPAVPAATPSSTASSTGTTASTTSSSTAQ